MTHMMSNNRVRYFVIVLTVSMVSTVLTIFVINNLHAQSNSFGGFKGIWEVRFDESAGEKKPTPSIPKEWRLISVSNGEKANSNILWFQDTTGNIYLVSGFSYTSNTFILNEYIQKINVN